jgi:shikimate dehydrogenase
MTDSYGVIGHPIAHSKSPAIHRLFANQTSQDISYQAFDIPGAELKKRLHELIEQGVRGLNVTVPHKHPVVGFMDHLSGRAELASAVNTISIKPNGEMTGDNTDGVGLVRDLQQNLHLELAGRRILILGAGGATRGIIPALLETKPETLRIANRTVQRAVELAERFKTLGEISACGFEELRSEQIDLLINATSAGLQGNIPGLPHSVLDSGPVCYDLSYAVGDTPFVRWAKGLGCGAGYQGWGMLVEQAAESFYLWRGVRPDTIPVRRQRFL